MRNTLSSKKSLRERLAWPSTLYRASAEVLRGANPESAGPDGMAVEKFRREFRSQIQQLQSDIRDGTYRPALGYGVAIPKNKNAPLTPENVRPITVFNVRDRIVQRAVSNLVWPSLRAHVYSDVSFGGIRAFYDTKNRQRTCADVKKNVKAAAVQIMKLRADGFAYVFETDIQRFFPSINKNVLLQRLSAALPDDSLNDILAAAISTTIENAEDMEARGLSECWDHRVGVPQGGVLSPLLANFYLAPFDLAMKNAGLRLVRYVDDLVILNRSRADAERAYKTCDDELRRLGLSIHELDVPNEKGKIKTRIVDDTQHFEFLGLRFNKRSIQPSQSKIVDLKDRIATKTHVRLGGATLVEVVGSLNHLLRGWMAAYHFCDFPSKLQSEIDHAAHSGLASWMKYHKLIKNVNSLTLDNRRRIGLWSATEAEIKPVSRQFHDHS